MARRFNRVCVYCGSQPGDRPEYAEAAYATGMALATAGIELVYGGGRAGLMGALAEGALAARGGGAFICPNVNERNTGHFL